MGSAAGSSRTGDSRLVRCLLPPSPQQEPPTHEHRGSPNQEAKIPPDPLVARHRLIDVMDPEDLVIDHALDQVENAEAHQHRAREQLTGPAYMRAMRLP